MVLDAASKVAGPPPTGLGAAGSGEPRAASEGQGPALQGAASVAGSASLGAATLLARFSPQPPCCGDGGGFRITAVP